MRGWSGSKIPRNLNNIACSEACFGDLQSQPGITIDDNLNPLPFDQEGNLPESILRPVGLKHDSLHEVRPSTHTVEPGTQRMTEGNPRKAQQNPRRARFTFARTADLSGHGLLLRFAAAGVRLTGGGNRRIRLQPRRASQFRHACGPLCGAASCRSCCHYGFRHGSLGAGNYSASQARPIMLW